MAYDVINKIKRGWVHLRLQPVRVFCFHHVSKEYDADSMNPTDWMQLDEFKNKVLSMQRNGVKFISLTDAHRHICKDIFRWQKYAVLTFDDGYMSLNEILPWMEEQHIPATLFINGKYLDGKSYRSNPHEKYLINAELFALTSRLIEIGSHGWEHTNAREMNLDEFKLGIELNIERLHTHPRYIPFHAYTWGKHTSETDRYLSSKDIIPVCMDGKKNYNDSTVVHRELIDK